MMDSDEIHLSSDLKNKEKLVLILQPKKDYPRQQTEPQPTEAGQHEAALRCPNSTSLVW